VVHWGQVGLAGVEHRAEDRIGHRQAHSPTRAMRDAGHRFHEWRTGQVEWKFGWLPPVPAELAAGVTLPISDSERDPLGCGTSSSVTTPLSAPRQQRTAGNAAGSVTSVPAATMLLRQSPAGCLVPCRSGCRGRCVYRAAPLDGRPTPSSSVCGQSWSVSDDLANLEVGPWRDVIRDGSPPLYGRTRSPGTGTTSPVTMALAAERKSKSPATGSSSGSALPPRRLGCWSVALGSPVPLMRWTAVADRHRSDRAGLPGDRTGQTAAAVFFAFAQGATI
jgi:hypothetical protein